MKTRFGRPYKIGKGLSWNDAVAAALSDRVGLMVAKSEQISGTTVVTQDDPPPVLMVRVRGASQFRNRTLSVNTKQYAASHSFGRAAGMSMLHLCGGRPIPARSRVSDLIYTLC